ncbi:glycosyltransferase family 39 protein [Pararhodospirillum photometricum]|nr:glycosyltransferase family 39 protein [Pararhodospirillum photometricum]
MLAALLSRLVPGDVYDLRHALGAGVGVIGLAVTWRLARLVGGARVGLIALGLLACTPAWYGDMFANPKDIPFAAAAAAVVWAMCAVLRDWPRPSFVLIGGLGLALGLMLGTRIGGLILGPPLVLALVARALGDAGPGRWGRALGQAVGMAGRLLLALPVAALVMAVVWPWVALGPTHLIEAMDVFSRFPFYALLPFHGLLVPTTDLPASYLPTLLALKLPEITVIAAMVAAVWGVGYAVQQPRSLGSIGGSQRLLLALCVLVPLLYAMLARPVAYNGIRHFLFMVPPLTVLAALVLDRGLEVLVRGWGRRAVWAGVAVLSLGLSLPVGRMVGLHPYQYIDFNLFAGGVRGAYQKFELEYWGTSLRELTALFVQEMERRGLDHPKEPWKVWVCGEPTSADHYFPPYLVAIDRDEEADFTLGTSQFYCPQPTPNNHTVVRLERWGTPLAFALDQRPTP